MKPLVTGLKAATTLKSAQGSCRPLSKVLQLGKRYRLFFPLTTTENGERDLLIAAVPGRRLDYEKLNVSFLRIDDFDQTETGKIIDNSGMVPYARIARVFHQAECAAEKDKAKEDAQKEADRVGRELDTVSLNAKLVEIEQKYNGDRNAKPNPIYATTNPMIQGITIEIATECLVVPLDKENAPEWGEATVASFPISGTKASQLGEIIANKDYCSADADFLEVGWSYIGTSKQEAGRNAAPQGISSELRLENKFPESWAANKDALNRVSKSAEAIIGKNMTMSSKATPKEVIELFKKYLIKHPVVLTYIDMEDETTKNAAKDMLDFGLVDGVKNVQESLLAIVNAEAKDTAGDETMTAAEALTEMQMSAAMNAQTMGEVAAAVGGNIDAVTAAPDNIDDL